ncbi:double-stranded RNA-binding protein Staufen homolog isoform X1 [Ylistrum balloti]|uniref:double-stranded RNA-binding protein Staufen homolog isoform X1 n=1 Tax=Ylistrum balloti TaxID=509963 RepID=UPI002905DBC8|nr:double-stranded RNA-binding protein Staufen homolog isoform X1 [Ylistrum balloti]
MSSYPVQNQQPMVQQNHRNKAGMMGSGILTNNTNNNSNSMSNPLMSVNNSYHPPTQSLVGGLQQKVLIPGGITTNQNQPAASSLTNQSPPVNIAGSVAVGSQIATPPGDQQPTATVNAQTPSEESEKKNQETMLANTKEKTPMCLINELARYNKIAHQYTLIDEQGPAHKKTFYVQLKLGDKEEYKQSGASIKKAQHAAAAEALENTTYTHPPPKPPKVLPQRELDVTTPTVELNALAMKRGEQTMYRPLDNRHQNYYPPPNYNYRGMYQQRYHYPRAPRVFQVCLKVGPREFIGEGPTRQDARHDAATKALAMLSKLPVPSEQDQKSEAVSTPSEDGDDIDKLKSEISLVHEIALKRNLKVSFDVIRESGPPHMKTFVTRCTVGEFEAEAEGNSKKMSKKKVAEMMLEKLRELPALPVSAMKPRNKPNNKKKSKNIIKVSQVQKANPDYGVGINPISRLIHFQQAQQKKEPVYTLVTERGLPRRREFVIQVQVDDQTCTGVGPNKKLAKRHAAEAMLTLLGYNKPSPQPTKPAIKSATTPEGISGEKKVTFVENNEDSVSDMNGKAPVGRQLVPGLLLLPDSKYTGASLYNPSLSGMGDNLGFGPSPRLRLGEIASRYDVDIKFDEFAGTTNNTEVLSRVTLMTIPPRIFHGSGPSPDAARDTASLEALAFLANIAKEDISSSGDAVKIKKEPGELANSTNLGGAHTGRVPPM